MFASIANAYGQDQARRARVAAEKEVAAKVDKRVLAENVFLCPGQVRVSARAVDPRDGEEKRVAFASWASNEVAVVLAAADKIKEVHGFKPNVNQIIYRVD